MRFGVKGTFERYAVLDIRLLQAVRPPSPRQKIDAFWSKIGKCPKPTDSERRGDSGREKTIKIFDASLKNSNKHFDFASRRFVMRFLHNWRRANFRRNVWHTPCTVIPSSARRRFLPRLFALKQRCRFNRTSAWIQMTRSFASQCSRLPTAYPASKDSRHDVRDVPVH